MLPFCGHTGLALSATPETRNLKRAIQDQKKRDSQKQLGTFDVVEKVNVKHAVMKLKNLADKFHSLMTIIFTLEIKYLPRGPGRSSDDVRLRT